MHVHFNDHDHAELKAGALKKTTQMFYSTKRSNFVNSFFFLLLAGISSRTHWEAGRLWCYRMAWWNVFQATQRLSLSYPFVLKASDVFLSPDGSSSICVAFCVPNWIHSAPRVEEQTKSVGLSRWMVAIKVDIRDSEATVIMVFMPVPWIAGGFFEWHNLLDEDLWSS